MLDRIALRLPRVNRIVAVLVHGDAKLKRDFVRLGVYHFDIPCGSSLSSTKTIIVNIL
jgi:hypothetical protein